eukprot:253171_1
MAESKTSIELDEKTAQTQQTPIGVHITTAITEIIFVVSELMCGIVCISYLKSLILPFNNSNQLLEILFDSLSYTLLITFIIFTVAYNIGLNIKTVIIRMGLYQITNISNIVFIIFIFHCLGIGVNYALFTYYNKWLFTVSNIIDPLSNTFNYYRMFDLFICTPIREEIVHRGLIFLLLYRHVNPMNYTNRNSNYNKSNLIAIKRCIIISGIVFGLIHIINLFDTTFSHEYAMVQIMVGCIISFFYTMRMIITTTLWEPIILHMINNMFSVFIDFTNDDVTHPLVFVPIVFTMMIYGVLIYWCWNNDLLRVWRTNKKKKKKLFIDFIEGQNVNDNDDKQN